MKTSQKVYTEYKIMPSLQLHQLRVAAVAKLICDNFDQPLDERNVVLACLFHDMGNIIKSNLDIFPDFLEPKGRGHWEHIKEEFISKYSKNHHDANLSIAREIGLPQRSVELIGGTGFSKIERILAGDSKEQKIVQYADLRVGPRGILPLRDRVEEGRKRYAVRAKKEGLPNRDEVFDASVRSAHELEKQLFTFVRIIPSDITDEAVAPHIERLKAYPLA
ncbi:HD domain-containing protein [Candidatus Kaiserbacteria bacterium]|nr:HD domain-containing protein [Candidatus Kaiserbacteria bacterium]